MTEEWATCIECGWTGVVDNSLTACPWCGYMVSVNIPITKINRYRVMGIEVGHVKRKEYIKYSKWKR